MPPVGLRLRLVVPLAWVLIIYGAFYTYFTAKTQQAEIMEEATVSTLRLELIHRLEKGQSVADGRQKVRLPEPLLELPDPTLQCCDVEHARILREHACMRCASLCFAARCDHYTTCSGCHVRSSRFTNRHSPSRSAHSSLIRSPRLPRNANTWPQ